jgi:ferredoxin
MIVAQRKPIDEILAMLAGCRRVLVLACGGCVSVCLTGGEKQADILASQLRLAAKARGQEMDAQSDCITRQCDREFFADLKADPAGFDAVLSIACGVGVGYMSELYPAVRVLPGLDTTFYGANVRPGQWQEYCHGCGQCMLAWTGGICPIARCAKSLVNGTCGGTKDGKCEVSPEMDCGWYLIYQKLKAAGRLDELLAIRPPPDWAKDRSGGLRRMSVEELADL